MAVILKAGSMAGLMHKIAAFYEGGRFFFRACGNGDYVIVRDDKTQEVIPGVKARRTAAGAWVLEHRT